MTWNPAVADGDSLEGVVLYHDGFPMQMVFVTLRDERSGQKHVMTSNEKGEFRFLCLEASTYHVRVQCWDAPEGTPPLYASGILPNRERLELRSSFDKPVTGKEGVVVGRVGYQTRRQRADHRRARTRHRVV